MVAGEEKKEEEKNRLEGGRAPFSSFALGPKPRGEGANGSLWRVRKKLLQRNKKKGGESRISSKIAKTKL